MGFTPLKLVFTYFGNGIALGAYGDNKEEVATALDMLYNYNAHEDKVTYLSDTFGYVLTDKDRLTKGIKNIFTADFVKKHAEFPAEKRRALWPASEQEATRRANKVVDDIPLENFLYREERSDSLYSVNLDNINL